MQQLSPSRISTMLACNRRHYWRYEVGLQPIEKSEALRFGSAWDRAMNARAIGAGYQVALESGVGEADFDEIQCAMLAGMLAGYYSLYENDELAEIQPQVEIVLPIKYSRQFEAICVLDGLARRGQRLVLIEHKSTGEDIGPDAEYWMRLKMNPQLVSYVEAARAKKWDIDEVTYDVVRKPNIRPKEIPCVDAEGKKIVVGPDGARVFKKDNTPRESGDAEKGYVVQTRKETAEEYADRLSADCRERPDFYYARREVPVLDSDIEEYRGLRDCVARQIVNCRKEEKRYAKPEWAWPRSCSSANCRICEFSNFCLQNISAGKDNVPSGMKVRGEAEPAKEKE